MKPFALTTSILTSAFFLTSTHAQLIPFWTQKPSPPAPAPTDIDHAQQPIGARLGFGMQCPSSPSNFDAPSGAPSGPPPTGDVILSDVLSGQRSINIFAGFTRDIATIATRLDTASLNTTVLAPLNNAITALPRKPWEDPRDYDTLGAAAYEGQAGEDRAARNMRRFTEAHIVPASPWKEGERVKTVGGREVWWEKKEDGTAVVQPGDVEVERVASRVANGEVWIMKDVLNYAS